MDWERMTPPVYFPVPHFVTPYQHLHMTLRMGIALSSLLSGLVAFYLHLWKLGKIGIIACASGGGCQLVQGSRFGWFLGYDVALIGAVGYSLLFVTAVLSTLPRFEDERWPNLLMQLMIWPAILFTVRLKYGEFYVLKSFCPWCLVSTVVITLCAILIVFDWRRLSRLAENSAE